MNPLYLKWGAIAAVVLALMLGAGVVVWFWQANHYGAVIATNEAARQADLASVANAAAAQSRQALEKQQVAEKKLADLDSKATEGKKNALAENEMLRQKYTATLANNAQLQSAVVTGYDRLRIAGSCSAGGGDVSASAASPSLDNAGTVELSADAGSRIFDIRAGIIADQSALRALQAYVKDVCLAQ